MLDKYRKFMYVKNYIIIYRKGTLIMLFNSYEFMFFLPIIAIVYYSLPQKARNLWLLAANLYFYMCWNAYYVALLTVTIVTSYLAGYLFDRFPQKVVTRQIVLWVTIVVNLGLLFFYKYLDFALVNMSAISSRLGMSFHATKLNLALPVGISFYTFKALSYVLDVYRRKYACTHNFIHYANYISFFPAILSGPIDRANHFIPQLEKKHKFDYRRVRQGMLLMLWGYFLKLVISDRAAQFANVVYTTPTDYSGAFSLIATLLYAVQIYCDFWGYSSTARGVAQVLGFSIAENFRQPYFATSIGEFWRRWHISLSSWLKEYVYIGLGGNRCSRARKYFNLMVTFLVSGLWHGSSWNYVIWGFLHGTYQIIGDFTKPFRQKSLQLMHVDINSIVHRNFCRIITSTLVTFSWIFFFANGTKSALRIIHHMFTNFEPWTMFDGTLFDVALSRPEFGVLILGIIIVLFVDILKYNHVNIQGWIERQHVLFRWTLYYLVLFTIIVFGVYGSEYSASAFVYFQF